MIAGIVVLGVIILGGLGYAIWKYITADKYFSVKEDSSKEQKIYISRKGVDLESGSLGGGTGELFIGNSKEYMDTIVMSQELPGSKSGRMVKYTLSLQNMNNKSVFRGNFVYEIILGRSVPNEGGKACILLPFPSVSRVHCRIFADGKQMYVEDLNSSFGTYINGVQVTQASAIKSGDVLELGKEKFAVEF